MTTDKRTIERFPLVFPVLLKSVGGEHADIFTRDISSKGAYVQTAHPLSLGEKVELVVTLPTGKNFLNCTGEVVRVEEDGMAIQFNRPIIVPVSKTTH
jgi:Tfp pilus assembly protein PilZ